MRVIIAARTCEFAIDIGLQEPVLEIKHKIEQLHGVPVALQTLSVSGWELMDGLDMEDYPIVTEEMEEDFRNLSEYGIREFSEIIVFLKALNRTRDQPPVRKLNVVVQTSSSLLNSACIPLELRDMDTVHELRQLLLARKILPRDDYLFIHKQRIMRDNCSLRWHGVEDGDSLYVFRGTVSRNGF
ncbi:hypothetical protein CK203_058383 [Vitis vinifera]|uniref:Ubiquitin-like domain-containing protein n=1 Tax=Vitis vinifera TaxID=29760 RepID=A0A438G875_VITVI|nr:hypothetical protein CK203_058383 [Vitis vinifera]